MKRVIIIGAGPAGLTAAIYTSRALLDTTVITGDQPGGQLMGTTEVENFPGFVEGIMGPELMMTMQKQAIRFGAKMVSGLATKVDLSGDIKKVWVGDKLFEAESVIIGTGAKARTLGLEKEVAMYGRGVSTCATCDGYFFKDKEIAVVGGGDSAMEEAIFLTSFATKVTVIHRRDTLKASKIMAKRAMDNDKIKFIWDSEVSEIKGESLLEGVKVKNLKTGEEKDLEIAGLFVAIGSIPATSLFEKELETNEQGHIVCEKGVKTSVSGVFVAGDVSDPIYRQAITSAGEGCKAALEAQRYLEGHEA